MQIKISEIVEGKLVSLGTLQCFDPFVLNMYQIFYFTIFTGDMDHITYLKQRSLYL